MSLLDVENLVVHYQTRHAPVRAVDGVSLRVERGEYFGLVGESGCGKTTLSRALMRLLPSNCRIVSGAIRLNGHDIVGLSDRDMRALRGRRIALVPQSAMNALDPVVRVGDQIAEAILAHETVGKQAALQRAGELFEVVGLDRRRIVDFPHQFSGGMRQRALIAMALALNPDLLIADEPTTAQDVIVKDQILHRMDQVHKRLHKSLFMVTHDISVVAENCERVAVMYAGKIMEYGSTPAVLGASYHPYTLGLKNAAPDIDGPVRALISIPGVPPDLADPPSGCRFHPRCPFATDTCRRLEPPFIEVEPDHYSACHYPEQVNDFRDRASQVETWQ